MKKILSNILISKEQSKVSSLFSFKTLSEKFFWALKWNSFESIIYQAIFIVHQYYLYSYIETKLYGIISTFFALSYLAITIIMGALDVALMPWIVNFTQNKSTFLKCIKDHIAPQLIFFLLMPSIVFIFFKKTWLMNSFSVFENHLIIMAIFIACEGIKKLLRHFLQLLFLNKSTALLEISYIIFYCSMVWGYYFYTHKFSIINLIIPFIITSLLSIIGMLSTLYFFYKKLPSSQNSPMLPLPTWKKIGYLRIIISINQISRSLFSSNILIPLSSSLFGFLEVARISFINYVSHTFTFFMYKICAPSIGAFFAKIKILTSHDQKRAFILVAKTIGLVLGIMTFFFMTFFFIKIYKNETLSDSTIFLLLGFLVTHTIENIFIMYEKFLIMRNRSELLASINIINLILSYIIIALSPSLFLAALICFLLRCIMFVLLSYGMFMLKI